MAACAHLFKLDGEDDDDDDDNDDNGSGANNVDDAFCNIGKPRTAVIGEWGRTFILGETERLCRAVDLPLAAADCAWVTVNLRGNKGWHMFFLPFTGGDVGGVALNLEVTIPFVGLVLSNCGDDRLVSCVMPEERQPWIGNSLAVDIFLGDGNATEPSPVVVMSP